MGCGWHWLSRVPFMLRRNAWSSKFNLISHFWNEWKMLPITTYIVLKTPKPVDKVTYGLSLLAFLWWCCMLNVRRNDMVSVNFFLDKMDIILRLKYYWIFSVDIFCRKITGTGGEYEVVFLGTNSEHDFILFPTNN